MKYTFEDTLWNAFGMETYSYLKDNVRLLLDGTNEQIREYKKKFVAFYRVRRNKEKWIDPFFEIFKEAIIDKKRTFNKYLKKIKKKCKHNNKEQTELSFTSKMLHTIDPNKFPILDSRVLSSLGIKNDNDAYMNLCSKIDNELLKNKKFKDLMKKIRDEVFEKLNESVTNYKLVDIILYSNPDID